MTNASEGKKEEHKENVPLTFSRWSHIAFDGNQQLGNPGRENLIFCFLNHFSLPQNLTPKELCDPCRT